MTSGLRAKGRTEERKSGGEISTNKHQALHCSAKKEISTNKHTTELFTAGQSLSNTTNEQKRDLSSKQLTNTPLSAVQCSQ